MSAESTFFKSYTKEESLQIRLNGGRPAQGGQLPPAGRHVNAGVDTVVLSEQAKSLMAQGKAPPADETSGENTVFELSEEDKLKIDLLERMIKALTGKKVKFNVLKKIVLRGTKDQLADPAGAAPRQARRTQGWSLRYDFHESYIEQQNMSFSAQGVIKTADGRELSFSLRLSVSREYAAEQNIRIRAGDAVCDPLVINLDGTAPELTGEKFDFDLNSDGEMEQISFLKPGSGFLVLDLNGDGRINDGKELFGPLSGNGFAELAIYDTDGNQWIDENDPVFNSLEIWTKDPDGTDRLSTLAGKGIGAIYLGGISTSFDLKNQENDLLGQLKTTGIYVKEDGLAGTVQQIDLAI